MTPHESSGNNLPKKKTVETHIEIKDEKKTENTEEELKVTLSSLDITEYEKGPYLRFNYSVKSNNSDDLTVLATTDAHFNLWSVSSLEFISEGREYGLALRAFFTIIGVKKNPIIHPNKVYEFKIEMPLDNYELYEIKPKPLNQYLRNHHVRLNIHLFCVPGIPREKWKQESILLDKKLFLDMTTGRIGRSVWATSDPLPLDEQTIQHLMSCVQRVTPLIEENEG